MNAPEIEPVDELIRKALPDQVPLETMERMRSQMRQFRARLAAAEPRSYRAQTWTRPAWWGLGVAVAYGNGHGGISAATADQLCGGCHRRTQKTMDSCASDAWRRFSW